MRKISTRRTTKPDTKFTSKSVLFTVLTLLLYTFAGLVVYSNSFDCSMVYDDVLHLVESTDLRDISDLNRWWHHDPSRPLGYLTLALNYHFHRLDVWGYHLVNVIIHILNACLVFWLVSLTLDMPVVNNQLTKRHKEVMALFAGLVFLTHPIQTQAVTYIIQRLTSQATLFYLLSLALYIYGRKWKGQPAIRTLFYAGSGAAGLFGMLTKQIVFTLPFAILLYEVSFISPGAWRLNMKNTPSWRGVLVLASGLLGILAILSLMSFDISQVFRAIPPQYGNTYTLTPGNYFLTQFRVVLTYIRLLVFPINQTLDYDYPISSSLFEWQTFASFTGLLALLAVACWLFKRHRLPAFGIFWIFLTLSIESSFIPIADPIVEHRLYLPMFGFCLVVISLFSPKRPAVSMGCLSCVVVAFGFAAHQRNNVWRDDQTLWSDAVLKSPNKARPHNNLGKSYLERHQPDLAEHHLKRAIEINSYYAPALVNLGRLYLERNQPDQAESLLKKAIEINPRDEYAHNNLGALYLSSNKPDLAEQYLQRASRLNPANAFVFLNLGAQYLKRNQPEIAETYLKKAIEINPSFVAALNKLGALYLNRDQPDLAEQYLKRAVQIDPYDADVHNNYGALYMKRNQPDLAETHLIRAVNIDQKNAYAHNNLGTLYLERNQFDLAEPHLKRAVEINQEYSEAHNNLGALYLNRNQADLAEPHLRRAVEIDPNLADAHNNLGKFYLVTNQPDLAEPQLKRTLEINPNLADAHNNLGALYMNRNQADLAELHLKKAVEINPNYTDARFNLERLYHDRRQSLLKRSQ